MAYIFGSIPMFECMVRAEYLHNLSKGEGEFVKAMAHGVRCVRGHTVWVQTMLMEPYGGCAFMVPLEAIVWKPCAKEADLTFVCPWDVFSSDFGVCELEMVRRGAVEVLPSRVKGQYLFTLDFAGSDLAEFPEQHKALHFVRQETGLIGAFPNNRLIWSDPAMWQTVKDLPRFESLAGEFRAEGNQHLMRVETTPTAAELNGKAAH